MILVIIYKSVHGIIVAKKTYLKLIFNDDRFITAVSLFLYNQRAEHPRYRCAQTRTREVNESSEVNSNYFEYDLSFYRKGIYLVKITVDENTWLTKIVKN